MKVRSLRLVVPTILSLVLLSFGLYFFVIRHVAVDSSAYLKLMDRAKSGKKQAGFSPYHFQQNRTGVAKDVWMSKKGNRFQMRLRSEDSKLVFLESEDRVEMVEHMKNVLCWVQEEVHYRLPDGTVVAQAQEGAEPRQVVRYMESDEAIYYYRTDEFVADQVHMQRYDLPGHRLPDDLQSFQPTMSGTAKKVEISMLGKELKFKAYNLKAKFHGKDSV